MTVKELRKYLEPYNETDSVSIVNTPQGIAIEVKSVKAYVLMNKYGIPLPDPSTLLDDPDNDYVDWYKRSSSEGDK